MIKKTLNIFHLIRLNNIVIVNLVVLVVSIILKISWNDLILYTMLTISSIMAMGNILNDILDIIPDEFSHPNRPLPSKNLNINEAKLFFLFFLITMLISSSYLNSLAQKHIYFIVLPMLISYNFYFKKLPFIGNIIIASLLGYVFVFTEIVLVETYHILYIPALLAFGLSLIREIIKDVQDYLGDKQHNINTLPVYFGQHRALYILNIIILLYCLISIVPYYFHIYTINYLLSLIFLIEIPLIILVFLLIYNPKEIAFKISSFITKYMVLNGLLVILIAYY